MLLKVCVEGPERCILSGLSVLKNRFFTYPKSTCKDNKWVRGKKLDTLLCITSYALVPTLHSHVLFSFLWIVSITRNVELFVVVKVWKNFFVLCKSSMLLLQESSIILQNVATRKVFGKVLIFLPKYQTNVCSFQIALNVAFHFLALNVVLSSFL
jgi:hypothetical protein